MNFQTIDRRQTLAPMTLRLIIINALIWVAQLALPRVGIDLVDLLGMHYFEANTFAWYQPLTYMFLHSPESAQHLIFNMLSLWIFGSAIEYYWGAKRFVLYYLVAGLSGALAQQATWYIELHPLVEQAGELIRVSNGYGGSILMSIGERLGQFVTIGASGAVFGILLAFGMLFPNREIYLLFVPFPIKAKYFVVGYAIIELLLGLQPTGGDSVAHFAHLGGMIGGLILILLWRRKGYIERHPY